MKERIWARFSVLRDLFALLWKHKLWWLVPIIVIMLALCALAWFAQTAAIPYIYTLF